MSGQAVLDAFARNLGVTHEEVNRTTNNPANDAIFAEGELRDNFGTEAKMFSYCFQEARQKYGPYHIFGSRETQDVATCIHKFVVAVRDAERHQ